MKQPSKIAMLLGAWAASSCLTSCKAGEFFQTASKPSSLTGPDYKGTKKYFGFAEPLLGMMGNEVRFDVRHTHDVFAAEQGGKYSGQTATRRADVTNAKIKAALDTYVNELGPDDMYVQYSAGHGMSDRLGVGITYDELRDRILQMKAKEIVIFTMACYSGSLVDSFNRKKEAWQGWKDSGRTLFVMSSSGAKELSATGPGVDAAEPVDARGAAGSRFGFALWKALRGDADGYGAGGKKDELITLGELSAFVTDEVRKHEKNQHTPVVTGVFDPGLVMARPAPALPPNPKWAEARDRLRPQIEALKAKVTAAGQEMKTINEELKALTTELEGTTPPMALSSLSALREAESALEGAATARSDSVGARLAMFASATADADPRMTTYAAESYADETADGEAAERDLTTALGRASEALTGMTTALTAAGDTATDVAARRQALLARHAELLETERRLKDELKEMETALQRVVDELSGLL